MTPYKSLSGKKSGVIAYEMGDDFIKVQFDNFKKYKYTSLQNGRSVIQEMKSLALASEGLSTYIAQNKSTLKFI